nr:hypothetical protein [Tanacetum cinerariifolium]
MDDPNITMEEYIRLEEEKAHRHAIVFSDELTSEEELSCEPMVNPLNNNEIEFRISFNEFDIKITCYFDDLDYIKDFENEFPAIVYNDALTSKLDFLINLLITGRSQEPKKVTMTDLFYLRGMDVGSVNIPYLLDRYFRMFSLGRKHEAPHLPLTAGQARTMAQRIARIKTESKFRKLAR